MAVSLRTQFENLGDCIINWAVVQELAKTRTVYLVHRGSPGWLRDRFDLIAGCKSFEHAGIWWANILLLTCRRQEHVVYLFKPGHYAETGGWKATLKSTALILFAGLCRILGVPFRRYGASLGEHSPLSAAAMRRLGAQHDCFGLRDLKSVAFANRLGIRATYSPDVAFLLPYNAEAVLSARKCFGLCFRRRAWLDVPLEPDTELLTAIRQIMEQQSASPLVITQVSRDHDLMLEIGRQLDCPEIQFEQSEASVARVFSAYAECKFVISNRLHSLLFAWSQGAVPVPLVDETEDGKVSDLFETLQLEQLVVKREDLGALPAHIQEIMQRSDYWRTRLYEVYADAKTRLIGLIKRPDGSFYGEDS